MYCKNCGAEIADGAGFCPNCGQSVQPETQAPETPAYVPEQVVYGQPEQPTVVQENLPNVLMWGIIGLAFSCSFGLSFLGIIFSAIGMSKAKLYTKLTGMPVNKGGKVGSILAKVGLIVGIVMTVVFIIWLIAIIAAAAAMSSYGFGYGRYFR